MESQKVYGNTLSLFDAVVSQNPKVPPQVPKDLLEYRNMNMKEKYNVNSANFFKSPEIEGYLDSKWKVELHNKSSFIWLWDVYQTTLEDKKRKILEAKMAQFKKAIVSADRPYPALAINFEEYPFTDHRSMDVDWNG